MNRTYRSLSIAHAALATIALVIVSPAGWAHDDDDDDEVIPYDEAELFFELNNTDGDLGIHALIDAEAWKSLKIEDPYEREMLKVRAKGRLRLQGLTEIFFESAEPIFEDLAPADFFARFPEGDYNIEGETLDGSDLGSEVELTHTMPAPPAPTVNTLLMAVQCDEDEDGYDAIVVSPPITIAWPEVTMSHPNATTGGAGVQPPIPVEINNYEVVVEILNEDVDSTFIIQLPPDSLAVTLPMEFIALGDNFKYEVLAREESFNQTAVESCFVLAE